MWRKFASRLEKVINLIFLIRHWNVWWLHDNLLILAFESHSFRELEFVYDLIALLKDVSWFRIKVLFLLSGYSPHPQSSRAKQGVHRWPYCKTQYISCWCYIMFLPDQRILEAIVLAWSCWVLQFCTENYWCK